MSQACTLHGPLQLSVEELQSIEPAAGQVRLRLGAGGICGSDLHYYQHGRAGVFAISESKAAFDLALDRSRSTKVQLIPG